MHLPRSFSRRAYKFCLTIHLWTGLGLGLWLTLIGLTGSMLAWMPELVTAEVTSRYPRAPGETTVPLSHALEAIKARYPDMTAKELSSVQMPTGRYPYYVLFRRIKNKVHIVLVDPVSANVHPMFPMTDLWMGKAIEFHTQLLFGVPGLLGNGLLSLLAMFLLISGLWMWWPSTVKQLKERILIKRHASFSRWLRDVHNVLGIYLYAVLFVTTLTAVLLVVNHATRGGIEKAVDKRAGVAEATHTVQSGGARLPIDRLVEIAAAAVPDAKLDGVRLPQKPEDPFQSRHLRMSGFMSSSIVYIDPYSGQILEIEHDRTASPGHKTVALIQDLHFGFFGGVWSKLIYTVAGLLPLGLFITGFLMWWRKKRGKTQKAVDSP